MTDAFFALHDGGTLYDAALLTDLLAHLKQALTVALGAAALLPLIARIRT